MLCHAIAMLPLLLLGGTGIGLYALTTWNGGLGTSDGSTQIALANARSKVPGYPLTAGYNSMREENIQNPNWEKRSTDEAQYASPGFMGLPSAWVVSKPGEVNSKVRIYKNWEL